MFFLDRRAKCPSATLEARPSAPTTTRARTVGPSILVGDLDSRHPIVRHEQALQGRPLEDVDSWLASRGAHKDLVECLAPDQEAVSDGARILRRINGVGARPPTSASYSRVSRGGPHASTSSRTPRRSQHADAARSSEEMRRKRRTREAGVTTTSDGPAGRTEQRRQRRARVPCPGDDDIHLPRRDHAASNLMLMCTSSRATTQTRRTRSARNPRWEPAERYEDVDSAVFAGQRRLRTSHSARSRSSSCCPEIRRRWSASSRRGASRSSTATGPWAHGPASGRGWVVPRRCS